MAIEASKFRNLEFAHRNDIIHGDLKPGNVIITERDGTINWPASTPMEIEP